MWSDATAAIYAPDAAMPPDNRRGRLGHRKLAQAFIQRFAAAESAARAVDVENYASNPGVFSQIEEMGFSCRAVLNHTDDRNTRYVGCIGIPSRIVPTLKKKPPPQSMQRWATIDDARHQTNRRLRRRRSKVASAKR